MAINSTAESLLAQVRVYQDQIAASRPLEMVKRSPLKLKRRAFSSSQRRWYTLREVSNVQQSATALSEAYQAGEDVPLTDVVVAMQKSSLAFETTLQVRNKVLQAYQDIMNMPV